MVNPPTTQKSASLTPLDLLKGWAFYVLAYLLGGFILRPSRYSHGQAAAQLLDQLSAAAISGIVFQLIRLFRARRMTSK